MLNWLPHRASAEPIVDLGDGQSVNSASQVYRLLKRSCEHHCLLEVRLDGAKDAYSSVVLEIGTERNYLLLDALTPAHGNARIKTRAAVAISTLLDNVELRFSSSVEKVATTGDSPSIRIAYPQRVYHAQHRQEYRVAMPLSGPARISIWLDDEHQIDGTVRDLSPSGFRLQLDAPLRIKAGSDPGCPRPLRFSLALAQDRIVQGELEICYAFESEHGKRQWVGTRILAMTASDQRVLDRCVADIDRRQCHLR